jgi:hypothetical protein
VDTNQRWDASEIKTHEEILALFRELDRIEERVKNLHLSEDEGFDTTTVLQEVERAEPSIKRIREPRSEKSIKSIQRKKQKKLLHLFLFEHHKKEQDSRKKVKRIYFSKKEYPSDFVPSAETEIEHGKEAGEEVKPVKTTFALHITDDGSLVGLTIKKPKPSKPENEFFERLRHRTETGEETEEKPATGFNGRMKRLFSKIIPRRSEEGETSGGIGRKIKGIFKRESKEEK